MTIDRRDEVIEILDCDITARPKTAPGIEALAPHVLGVSSTAGVLLIDFDERAAPTLEAFVDAERVCCSGIDWRIEHGPGLRLSISAGDAQLTALQSLWSTHKHR